MESGIVNKDPVFHFTIIEPMRPKVTKNGFPMYKRRSKRSEIVNRIRVLKIAID